MNEKRNAALKNPWIYLIVTFAWTWFFWGIGIVKGVSMESSEGLPILLLGLLGPMITGIAFTYLTGDKEEVSDYWNRIINFKRIPAKWYLVIFLFVPALNILAALIDILLGGTGATWGETAVNALTDPVGIVFSILFASLVPFIEELGWRGYVLDRFQEKNSALKSSLILGAVWSLWHLPMFFIPDSYQEGLGVGTLAFWLFMIGIVPLNLPFTWIYNNTGRSILAVILFHSMVNFTGELIALNERADTISIGLWFAAAIGITVIWGAKTFMKEDVTQS
ncbi:MAG: CPBP family intramembrane metalloprotease [Anaerolineae bacterium]|nr:CPBP family intramembrane metalloprotease [Anaerolineae bacterium]